MICYVLAMGKQHLGPHVVVGYGIEIFWPSLFITSPDHLASTADRDKLAQPVYTNLFGADQGHACSLQVFCPSASLQPSLITSNCQLHVT